MNYTHFEELYDTHDGEYNLAPRIQWCDVYASGSYHYSCVTLWDTDREKEIDFAPDYPFEKLGPGECVITSEFQDTFYSRNKPEVGDDITLYVPFMNLTDTMIAYFNEFVLEDGRPPIHELADYSLTLKCTVAGILDQSYGKY